MFSSAVSDSEQPSIDERSRLVPVPSDEEKATTSSRSRSVIVVTLSLLFGIAMIFAVATSGVSKNLGRYTSQTANGASAAESLDSQVNLAAAVAPPTRAPVLQPTAKPTAAPSSAPISPTRNATIVDGYLTIDGVKSYVGKNSSNINAVISQYFPKFSYTQMTINTKNTVWMNASVALSYLTLVGDYVADVPIVLPHQFILVMNRASLNAVPNFPTNTKPMTIGGTTIAGNPNPDTNVLSISATFWAIIVMNGVYNSGVVSPGGPSQAYIGCKAMPYHGTPDIIVGPAGVLTTGSGAVTIDGIHIDNCGLNNGNIALYGTSRAEVANCLLEDARTRGIWVIIMSFAIIHDTEISGSLKFGIDLDANCGPTVVMYRNYIHDNAYQGVFIEQGAQFSVTADNDLPRNQNGVSFYNNLFAQLCSDHVVLSNKCYQSTSAGINVGSTNDNIVGFWPTTDSYIIGNNVYDNGQNVPKSQEKAKYGFNSNGPAYGIFLIANNDNQGQGNALHKFLAGGIVISDPNQRMKMASGITPTAAPTSKPFALPKGSKPIASPTLSPSPAPSAAPSNRVSALNVTITNGVVTDVVGQPILPLAVNTVVGTNCSSLQTFVDKYFASLSLGSASKIPWMWQIGKEQVISFLTLVGGYTCDAPLSLPEQLVLVLQDATITADAANFPNNALGLIIANSADHSHVVSPGGPKTATIDCGSVTGPAGIYIYNSSYFSIDGITVTNCGGKYGAITIFGTSDHELGNSTSVINSVVSSSAGHGIYVARVVRPVLYMNSITSSVGSGIKLIAETYGPIVSGNMITNNGGDGIQSSDGTRNSVFRGNLISGNGGSGVVITNSKGKKSVIRCVVITNQIIKNSKYSIYLGVDEFGTIVSTVIGGNTIKDNTYGMFASDPSSKGIQKTLLANNDDQDGVMGSFLSLTNGNSKDASGNYFLDPLNRGAYYNPLNRVSLKA